MEEVGERASEGTSEGRGLEGRQRGQRHGWRQSEQSTFVVLVVLQQVLGRSRGTCGRLVFFSFLGVIRGPVEGQRFVGSGTVGAQKHASTCPVFVRGQQLVVLFLGAGMPGQGAAETRSR